YCPAAGKFHQIAPGTHRPAGLLEHLIKVSQLAQRKARQRRFDGCQWKPAGADYSAEKRADQLEVKELKRFATTQFSSVVRNRRMSRPYQLPHPLRRLSALHHIRARFIRFPCIRQNRADDMHFTYFSIQLY